MSQTGAEIQLRRRHATSKTAQSPRIICSAVGAGYAWRWMEGSTTGSAGLATDACFHRRGAARAVVGQSQSRVFVSAAFRCVADLVYPVLGWSSRAMRGCAVARSLTPRMVTRLRQTAQWFGYHWSRSDRSGRVRLTYYVARARSAASSRGVRCTLPARPRDGRARCSWHSCVCAYGIRRDVHDRLPT